MNYLAMREHYENEESLSKEEAFKKAIEEYKDLQLIKLPMAYNCDFAAVKKGERFDEVVGVMEVKCRKGKFGQYPDLLISKNKIDGVINRWNLKKFWFVIAIRWDDKDVYYQWRPSHTDDHKVVIGGRKDRGDWQDTEPVYLIENKHFREFT